MGLGDFWLQFNNGKKEQLSDIRGDIRIETVDPKYRSLFSKFDFNSNGSLEAGEMSLLTSLIATFAKDEVLDADEAKSIFGKLGIDADKNIDFLDFVNSISEANKRIRTTSEEILPDGSRKTVTEYIGGIRLTAVYFLDGDLKYTVTEVLNDKTAESADAYPVGPEGKVKTVKNISNSQVLKRDVKFTERAEFELEFETGVHYQENAEYLYNMMTQFDNDRTFWDMAGIDAKEAWKNKNPIDAFTAEGMKKFEKYYETAFDNYQKSKDFSEKAVQTPAAIQGILATKCGVKETDLEFMEDFHQTAFKFVNVKSLMQRSEFLEKGVKEIKRLYQNSLKAKEGLPGTEKLETDYDKKFMEVLTEYFNGDEEMAAAFFESMKEGLETGTKEENEQNNIIFTILDRIQSSNDKVLKDALMGEKFENIESRYKTMYKLVYGEENITTDVENFIQSGQEVGGMVKLGAMTTAQIVMSALTMGIGNASLITIMNNPITQMLTTAGTSYSLSVAGALTSKTGMNAEKHKMYKQEAIGMLPFVGLGMLSAPAAKYIGNTLSKYTGKIFDYGTKTVTGAITTTTVTGENIFKNFCMKSADALGNIGTELGVFTGYEMLTENEDFKKAFGSQSEMLSKLKVMNKFLQVLLGKYIRTQAVKGQKKMIENQFNKMLKDAGIDKSKIQKHETPQGIKYTGEIDGIKFSGESEAEVLGKLLSFAATKLEAEGKLNQETTAINESDESVNGNTVNESKPNKPVDPVAEAKQKLAEQKQIENSNVEDHKTKSNEPLFKYMKENNFPKNIMKEILINTNKGNVDLAENLCRNKDFPKDEIGKILKAINDKYRKMLDENIETEKRDQFRDELISIANKLANDINFENKNIISKILENINEFNIELAKRLCFENKLEKNWQNDIPRFLKFVNEENISLAIKLYEDDIPIYWTSYTLLHINKNNLPIAEKLYAQGELGIMRKILQVTEDGTISSDKITDDLIKNAKNLNNILPIGCSAYEDGLVDILVHDPKKYQRIINSGVLGMINANKLDVEILKRLNRNADFSNDIYNDLKLVKSGKSIVSEFPNGTDISQAFVKTKVGDVVEIGSKMYINDGAKLVEWKMTKAKYLELFPPVERFATVQNGTGDCYFISPLSHIMSNPNTRAEFYKSFEYDGKDVKVTIKAYEDYQGSYKFIGGKFNDNFNDRHAIGCQGVQMYERAYAKVALRTKGNKYAGTMGINDLMDRIDGGREDRAISEILGYDHSSKFHNDIILGVNDFEIVNMKKIPYTDPVTKEVTMKEITADNINQLLDNYDINNPKTPIVLEKLDINSLEALLIRAANSSDYMLDFGGHSDLLQYNIQSTHAHSIVGYDAKTKTVKINQPTNFTLTTKVPLEKFYSALKDITYTKVSVKKPLKNVENKVFEVKPEDFAKNPSKIIEIQDGIKKLYKTNPRKAKELQIVLDMFKNPTKDVDVTDEQISAVVNFLMEHYAEKEAYLTNQVKLAGLNKLGKFLYRLKGKSSTRDKITNYIKDAIKARQKDPTKPVKTLLDAYKDVRDKYASRTVFEKTDLTKHPEVEKLIKQGKIREAQLRAAEIQSEPAVKTLMDAMTKAVKEGQDLSAIRISNYTSENGIPIFSERQLEQIKKHGAKLGLDVNFIKLTKDIDPNSRTQIVNGAATKAQPSGYTALQVNFVTRAGEIIEWQFRGELVDKFAEAEHLPYDLRTGKRPWAQNPELEPLYKPIAELLKETVMPKEAYKQLNKYFTDYYTHLRKLELGFESKEPRLEDYEKYVDKNGVEQTYHFDKRLEAKNLEKLHDNAEEIKRGKNKN